MTTNKSKNQTIAMAFIGLIILMGLVGYLWFDNNQLKDQIEQQKTELFEVEKIQVELQTDYEDAIAKLDDLRSDKKSLNELIEKQKTELKSQKNRISGLIWSEKELGKARAQIKKLNAQADAFIAEVERLKSENQILTADNEKLQQEKTTLVADLMNEKEQNEELSMAKAVLASEKEELEVENDKMEQKIDIASAIKINFMKTTGYFQQDNKLKEKSRAKRINMVRTCFVTETNVITSAGDEKFFLRIIDPGGETMAVEALGSGILTNKLTGEQVRYTQSGTLNYNNEDATGCIDWMPNAGYGFKKGVHQVEIYNKGYMVGKGTFKLK